jgi:hypothetical protein
MCQGWRKRRSSLGSFTVSYNFSGGGDGGGFGGGGGGGGLPTTPLFKNNAV